MTEFVTVEAASSEKAAEGRRVAMILNDAIDTEDAEAVMMALGMLIESGFTLLPPERQVPAFREWAKHVEANLQKRLAGAAGSASH